MFENFQINKYKSNGELIGSGSFANVCKGYNIETGEIVAIKIIKPYFENKSDRHRNQIETEIKIIKSLNHVNIVNCYGVYRHPINNALCIIMEYCDGGTLENYIKNKGGKLTEYYTQQILKELIKGLKYLKENNIIHRDLKPENLLIKYDYINHERYKTNMNSPKLEKSNCKNVKKKFTLKIADFGLSRILSSHSELAQTQCGSRLYMAPEIYRGEEYSYKADLWSVGGILYRIITGKPLFTKLPPINKFSLTSQLFNPNIINNDNNINISNDCLDLLTQLLQNNPINRIGWDEFIKHPFLINKLHSVNINHLLSLKDNILFEFCIIDKDSTITSEQSIISNKSFIYESQKYDFNLNNDELKLLNKFDMKNSLFLNNSIITLNDEYLYNNNISESITSLKKLTFKNDKLANKIETNYNYILSILKLAQKKYKYNYFNDVYIIYKYILLSIKNILIEISKIINNNKNLETKNVKELYKNIYKTFLEYMENFKIIESNIDKNTIDKSININYIIITYILSYTKKAELALMFNNKDSCKEKLYFCINCLKYLDKFIIPSTTIIEDYNQSPTFQESNLDLSKDDNLNDYSLIDLKNILKNKKLTIILIRKYISSMLSLIKLIDNNSIDNILNQ